ncbi:precorrin-6A synthase (deacetylating) [Nocardioides currus]|uniref:Precorrin-6A synthase (Deacetylating) n=1 Tax=Nocardioides currus TaxID=2133958 RepID=A0A2R7YV89_9ACTN|nr:precorrin-6A synthase (deacetylating) [Nocardioides currus]PUA80231.1 precorrin-6A synthase (deacetylating) [Nocardioides currus]
MRIRVVGVGMGPQHVTAEAAEAIRSCDYVIAASKNDADGLLAVRRSIAASYGVEVVAVPDPPRERDDPADYPGAVRDWHAARVAAYDTVLRERGGTAGFLVWGDPSTYDSTIRIVESLGIDFDVVPGISAPQLLAARHRIVLHGVGQPVHVTTARRLQDDVAAGQTNLVVMLSRTLDLTGLDDWSIWWGANLGTDSEELLAGRIADVVDSLEPARERARDAAGWVMDVCLLRAPA